MEVTLVKAAGPGGRDRAWLTVARVTRRGPVHVVHDLPHLAVESLFGLDDGLWAELAAGDHAAASHAATARDPKRQKSQQPIPVRGGRRRSPRPARSGTRQRQEPGCLAVPRLRRAGLDVPRRPRTDPRRRALWCAWRLRIASRPAGGRDHSARCRLPRPPANAGPAGPAPGSIRRGCRSLLPLTGAVRVPCFAGRALPRIRCSRRDTCPECADAHLDGVPANAAPHPIRRSRQGTEPADRCASWRDEIPCGRSANSARELGAARPTESITLRDSCHGNRRLAAVGHSLKASCMHTASDVFVILKAGRSAQVARHERALPLIIDPCPD